MSPPVPWVAPVLYAGVLLAGGYAEMAGLGQTRPLLFVGGLVAVVLLDLVERRRFPDGPPTWVAAGLLVTRFVLFVIVAAGDGSGLSRVLFLLLPFWAYFAFGLTVSLLVGALCVGLVAAVFEWTIPDWHRSAEHVSDLLMFSLGLVLTITMAAVAGSERQARAQLEATNESLRASATQVAELSATAERNRLARDIHDSLGHHLTAIALLLDKAMAFRDRDPATADEAVTNARRSTGQALDDVRRSVGALHDQTGPFRLSAALDELARQANDGRLAVTLDWQGDESRYDTATLRALYRVAQEGMTNIRRHANATQASIDVQCGLSSAHLVITDNGTGVPPGAEGFGLRGMRERVELIGGSVALEANPGGGTRLAIVIPQQALA